MTEFHEFAVDEQIAHLLDFAREALRRWPGTYDQLRLVKYRENAVFSARRTDGKRVALRVHRPGYHSDQSLRSELDWMKALARQGMRIPDVCPAEDGSVFVHVTHAPIPERRQVDMLAWLDGEQLGGIEESSHRSATEWRVIFREIGELAADLHLHTQRWQMPDEFERHSWDAAGLIGSDPFWGRYLDLAGLSSNQRGLLEQASGRAAKDLADLGRKPEIFGLIHGDMVPENLLISRDGLTLIDFDDSGFGWYMFELATALFFMLDHPAYPELEAALFEGYSNRRDEGVDRRLMPLFLFLRAITYLGWVHTRHDTLTAREMTPMFIERACALAADYLHTS